MQNKLFNKTSTERMSSPEKMNDYIQVANPSIWMILIAALLLLTAVLVWGVFGSVSTTATVNGLADGGRLVCYINTNAGVNVEEGMQVAVSGDMKTTATGSVTRVSEMPLSYAEACAGIESDYAVYALNIADWNIRAEIETDAALTDGAIYSVSITTQSLRPIELVFQ